MKAWRMYAALAAVVVVAGVAAAAATSATSIANGGFETGDFTGWTVDQNGAGAWGITSSGSADCGTAPQAPTGTSAALWDMGGPSEGFLSQQFTVPANGVLSVDFAYENSAEAWVQDGVDPYDLGAENEWARIDVIRASAAGDTLDPGDILATVFDSQAGSPAFDQNWTVGTANLSAFAGQDVVFRVLTVNTLDCFPVWIDNVEIRSGTHGPPHAGYCAVAGDTYPTTGAAIPPGTFVNLDLGQPDTDPHFKGATPSIYVEGKGITCDPPPPGYTQHGFAGDEQHVPSGLYPYYKAG